MSRHALALGRARSGAALTLVSLGLCLLAWQVVATAGWVSPAVFPDLAQVGRAFLSLFTVGYPMGTRFWTHLAMSFGRILTGVALGGLVAVVLGFAIGWFPVLYDLCRPVITVARGIPAVALIPLAIAWFGIDEFSKVALIFYATFWIMLTHVIDSVRQVNPDWVRAGQAFGLGGGRLFLSVVLPAVLPRILTALRIGIAMGFVVVITAEMAGTVIGMGAMIMDARRFYRPDIVIVGMALIGAVGYTLSTGLERLERRLTRWARTQETEA